MGSNVRDSNYGAVVGYTMVGYNSNPHIESSLQYFKASSTYHPNAIGLSLRKYADYPDPWPEISLSIHDLLTDDLIAICSFPGLGLLDTFEYRLVVTSLTQPTGLIQEGRDYYLLAESSHSGEGYLCVGKTANVYATGYASAQSGGLDAAWSSLPENDLVFEVRSEKLALGKFKVLGLI